MSLVTHGGTTAMQACETIREHELSDTARVWRELSERANLHALAIAWATGWRANCGYQTPSPGILRGELSDGDRTPEEIHNAILKDQRLSHFSVVAAWPAPKFGAPFFFNGRFCSFQPLMCAT